MKFKDFVKKKDISLRVCSRQLNVKYQAVWRIFQGLSIPTLVQAAKIIDWSDGEVDIWDLLTEEEMKEIYPDQKIG